MSNTRHPEIGKSKEIMKEVEMLEKHLNFIYPPMCWRFSSTEPNHALFPKPSAWHCLFQFIKDVSDGNQLCLSREASGCSGAATYLGFKKPGPNAGTFLFKKERFKKDMQLANRFYQDINATPAASKYAVLSRVDNLTDNDFPEVIVLWVNASTLTSLVTLANFDRTTNNNVIIPFASGCQSIWTIPYNEKHQDKPKAVVGLMDPSIRKLLPHDLVSFSVITSRFIEMANNVPDSFIINHSS